MWEVMNTMTTRQAFETEAKKHGFILDRLDKSGEYVQLITEQAWNIWQAATAAALEAPAQPERKPTTRKAFEEWVKKNHPLRQFGW